MGAFMRNKSEKKNENSSVGIEARNQYEAELYKAKTERIKAHAHLILTLSRVIALITFT